MDGVAGAVETAGQGRPVRTVRRAIGLSTCSFAPGFDRLREPRRPYSLRHVDYEDRFDFTTLFYDCFWSANQESVVLIGPPAHGAYAADELRIFAQPADVLCQTRVLGSRGIERILVSVPEGTSSIEVHIEESVYHLSIQPNLSTIFHGRRVATTLTKDNHPLWIQDWTTFHRVHHGCDGILLYDNASRMHPPAELNRSLRSIAAEIPVVILSWPFAYGVADYRHRLSYRTLDSVFCQFGMFEHARRRFLHTAKSVLNADIDELVQPDGPVGVFEAAETSVTGQVVFGGRWVVNQRVEEDCGDPRYLPRHRDFGYVEKTLWAGCEDKWAVVPEKVPEEAQWGVHDVIGMPRTEAPGAIELRHFKGINTNWNLDSLRRETARTSAVSAPLDRLRLDEDLRRQLEQACPAGAADAPAPETPEQTGYWARLRARRLDELGHAAAAREAAAAAVAAVPEHPGFLEFLAELEERAAGRDSARQHRARAAELREQDAVVHFQNGRWFADEGKLMRARRCFERAIKLDPKFRPAWEHLAVLYRFKYRTARALSTLRKCAEHSPEEPAANAALAQELLRHSRISEALVYAQAAVDLDPNDPNNWHTLAVILHRAKRRAEAEEAVVKGIVADRLNERMLSIGASTYRRGGDLFANRWSANLWVLHVLYARLLLERGNLPAAHAAARKALHLRSWDSAATGIAAKVMRALGDGAEADRLLEEGIQTARKMFNRPLLNVSLMGGRASIVHRGNRLIGLLQAVDRLPEAIAVIEQSLSFCPDAYELHARLAQLYEASGDRRRAVEVLRSAIREMPSAAFLHRELSRVAEDSEEALDAARAAATLEPDNPALKRRLAARLQAEGRSAQAEVELRSVLEIEPHSADDYYTLSKFLKRQGRLAEAADAARQAVLIREL